MQYLVLPRLLAVADIAWRQKGSGDWQNFLNGVDRFSIVLDSLGMNHARSMWNIQHTLRPDSAGRVTVELRCERPDAQIRYSFADPTFNQPYAAPLTLDKSTLIYATTFKNGKKQGQTLTLPVNFNQATGHKVISDNCRNGLASVLTNGLNGSLRNSDLNGRVVERSASFTVDLGSSKNIDRVTLGTLINSDICVVGPKRVELSVSSDGVQFTPLAIREFTRKPISLTRLRVSTSTSPI